MDGVKKKFTELRNQLEDRDEKICGLTRELEEERREKNELENINKSLEYKLQKVSDDLEVTEERLDNAERTKSSLETSYTDTTAYTKNQVDNLERDLDTAQNDLESYKTRFIDAENGREVACREIGVLTLQNAKLEDDLELAEEKYEKIKQELEATLAELNEI